MKTHWSKNEEAQLLQAYYTITSTNNTHTTGSAHLPSTNNDNSTNSNGDSRSARAEPMKRVRGRPKTVKGHMQEQLMAKWKTIQTQQGFPERHIKATTLWLHAEKLDGFKTFGESAKARIKAKAESSAGTDKSLIIKTGGEGRCHQEQSEKGQAEEKPMGEGRRRKSIRGGGNGQTPKRMEQKSGGTPRRQSREELSEDKKTRDTNEDGVLEQHNIFHEKTGRQDAKSRRPMGDKLHDVLR